MNYTVISLKKKTKKKDKNKINIKSVNSYYSGLQRHMKHVKSVA